MTIKRKSIYISIVILLTLILLVFSYVYYVYYVYFSPAPPPPVVEVVQPEPEMIYGVPRDSFIVFQGVVRNGQFLSDILLSQRIDLCTADKIFKKSQLLFDFRRMKMGNKYAFLTPVDSTKHFKRFVYEIDMVNYLSVDIGKDTIIVSRGEKKVVTVEKEAVGEIRSSMWKTIQDNNQPPMLAITLSEIYAWTVDFFGIEKGDYYKVIYSEDFVDDKSIGISKVHAAVFSHKGREIYAFSFQEDSAWNFFDENGQSLRKAFLKAPLKFSRISSHFSNSRLHPILKIRRPHHGIDYAAPTGTPVLTIGDGTIVVKGWDGKGGGNYMKIKHNSVYTTVYMHLSGFAKGIAVGQHVSQGQLIGYVGSTGLASGPHLDFRVFQNNKPIDPLKVDAPPVEPVKSENMANYKKMIIPLKNSLDSLKIPKRKLLGLR